MIDLVEKISVNIKVIGLNVEHNFLIPQDMSVFDAVELIVKALCEEYPNVKNTSSTGHALMQVSSGKVLQHSCSFKQLGIVQGERLILI